MAAQVEVMHGLSLIKADPARATAEHPNCQQQKSAISPQSGMVLQEDEPPTW